MENKLVEFCGKSGTRGLECVYCRTSFDCHSDFRAHILGEGGAIACAYIPVNLRAECLEAGNRSSVLVCATIHVRDVEYVAHIVSSARGIFVEDVVMGEDPANNVFTTNLKFLVERKVDAERLIMCLTDTNEKQFISHMFFETGRHNWMSCLQCPFGDLLQVIHSQFEGKVIFLEWGSIIFHFLVKFLGLTWTREIDKFFIPQGLKWSSSYTFSRIQFDGFLQRFSAIFELLKHEKTLSSALQRSELQFNYSEVPYGKIDQILDYEMICNKALNSPYFWDNLRFIADVGQPLLEVLSCISKDCTAGEFYLGVVHAQTTLSGSRYCNEVKETVKKLGDMVKATIYKATAVFHPRFEGGPSLEVISYLSSLLEGDEKEAFEAMKSSFLANDHLPASWWTTYRSRFPTLANYARTLMTLPCSVHLLMGDEWDLVVDNYRIHNRYLAKGNRQISYEDAGTEAIFGNFDKCLEIVSNIRWDVMLSLRDESYDVWMSSPDELPQRGDSFEDYPSFLGGKDD